MDGGPFLRWNTEVTNGEWAWNRANNNNDELTFDLTVGTHTLVIKQREELAKFNTVAVTTQLADFQGGAIENKVYKVLRYDLKEISGKDATLIVNVSEFDAESKTILISDLRIETSETIRIKDVLPLVNLKANPQHSSYRIVDETIAAPGGPLSEASMVLVGDEGFSADNLSFTFGLVE